MERWQRTEESAEKDGRRANEQKKKEKNESFAMDKTIYFILSKQSRMQTGLYFQLVVVTPFAWESRARFVRMSVCRSSSAL